MTRARKTAVLVMLFAGFTSGAQAALREEFAWSLPLEVPAGAPLVRLDVPFAVYRDCVDPGLGDLRVLNGAGELVPYELRRPEAAIVQARQTADLRLFPLRGAAAVSGAALQLRAGEGRNVTVTVEGAQPEADTAPLSGYLLDTRHLSSGIDEITFAWAEDTADFSTQLTLAASDDLVHWRDITARAPVARLRHDGAVFEQRGVTLPATRARFWRVSAAQPGALPRITQAVVSLVGNRVPVERLQVEITGQAEAQVPGSYLFDLGAQLPADRLSLILPDINTVARVTFLARTTSGEPWRRVATGTVHRLQSADGELTSAAMAIVAAPQRYWRVTVDPRGGGIGGGVPRLRVGWLPDELLFVTRGSGPFELVFGSAAHAGKPDAGAAALFEALAPSTHTAIPEAQARERRVAGGAERLRPPKPPGAWRLWILWAALLAGVAVLGTLALRLARQMRAADPMRQSGRE